MDYPDKLAILCTHDTGRKQTQHRKLKREQHEPHQKLGVNADIRGGQTVSASHKTPAMLLM